MKSKYWLVKRVKTDEYFAGISYWGGWIFVWAQEARDAIRFEREIDAKQFCSTYGLFEPVQVEIEENET